MTQNTLIVSEKEQLAYLPYNDIKVPLNRFKNAPISRFRESIDLILHRENGSIFQAIDLGLELMFNYKLNPIIIAACKNLDELDIYLDCLEENELEDFTCFKIRFEVAPEIYKKQVFSL